MTDMPLNGIPCMSDEKFWCRYRPSYHIWLELLPGLSVHGASGSIRHFTVASHCPANCAIFSWAAPGFPAASIASIIFFCFSSWPGADLSPGLSPGLPGDAGCAGGLPLCANADDPIRPHATNAAKIARAFIAVSL